MPGENEKSSPRVEAGGHARSAFDGGRRGHEVPPSLQARQEALSHDVTQMRQPAGGE